MKSLVSRTLQFLLSLLFVVGLVFVALRLTGDPVRALLPDNAPPDVILSVSEDLGLDKPVPIQFAIYLQQLARGDLGVSIRNQVPVSALIVQRLPATLELGIAALLIAHLIAIPLGLYGAKNPGGAIDRFGRWMGSFGQAIPVFWLGIILVMVFAVWLRILPATGRGNLAHLVLPASTLAWVLVAGLVRLTRSSALEVLAKDYVTLARTKGLSERRVLWRHVLRNSAIPVITFSGVVVASVLTGSVVTETVFGWPGLGRLLVDALTSRDFPVVQGVVLLLAAVYLCTNFVVDLLYRAIDPRLKNRAR